MKKQKLEVEDKCDLFSWFGYPTDIQVDKIIYALLHKRMTKFQQHYHVDKPTGNREMCLFLNMVRQISNATGFPPLIIID